MMKSYTGALRAAVGTLMIIGSGVGPSAAATLLGEAQTLGEGTVQTYVEVDATDRPTAIGILFTEPAFAGLPPLKNATSRCFDLNENGTIDGASECEGDLEFQLTMPTEIAERDDIPFRWVGINWNAEGHPPAVWSVPHFDMHFYIASFNEIALIRVGKCGFFTNCDDFETAIQPVAEKYVPPDHVNVKGVVSRMGNHLIDVRTPELADPPKRGFTHNWIFGSYGGRITFYEPMITLAYLLSHPDSCTPIRQPSAWQESGYYPTKYCIRYSNDRGAYTVSMEGLVERKAE